MHVSCDNEGANMAERKGGRGACMKENEGHRKQTPETVVSCKRKRARMDGDDQMHEELHLREKEAILEDGKHP